MKKALVSMSILTSVFGLGVVSSYADSAAPTTPAYQDAAPTTPAYQDATPTTPAQKIVCAVFHICSR